MSYPVNALLVRVEPSGIAPPARGLFFSKEFADVFNETNDYHYPRSKDSEKEQDLQEVHPNLYQSHSR